jgi:predicted negative regulator of RcsB-dependent stress response
MKKEDLRYDPVHDKIAAIIDYIDNNKNVAIQGLLVIGLMVGGWGYYSGLERDNTNTSKALVGVAQNAYNAGQVDLSIPELKNIVEEYSGTDAATQALVYLLNNAYAQNADSTVLLLGKEYGWSNSDGVLDAGFYETLGNSGMNTDHIGNAINNFRKADKLSSAEYSDLRFKLALAVAFIAKDNFSDAALVLNEVLGDEDISYSDKSKGEELLALANFRNNN